MDKGAHFYRCDFQVHSPRDQNWFGKRAITEEERAEYASRFVKTCREKNLHAVAITDHHDVAFYKYIKEAAENEVDENGEIFPVEDRLIVFPGMELSIGKPSCQILIIFDPDINIEDYQRVPTILRFEPTRDDEATTCMIEQLDYSIEEIQKMLSDIDGLRDRFIILPNVTPNGHKTILREGNHTIFSKLPCVGGYIEGMLYDDIKIGKRRILEGEDLRWSSRAYGVFQTSDCRRDDLEDLGKYSTWVKWSKPSAEALRQACLSKVCRISQDTPKLPDVFIKKIVVSNSKFLGPIDLSLNPQFNALIGGRGTGKSSLLEYLRWGLCDPSIESTDYKNVPTYEKKRSDLIANTLESVGASVTVEWIKNGVTHVVKRNSVDHSIELKIGNQPSRKVSAQDVRALIGIQAYSQKQLSTVGINISELRRFIEHPIQTELQELANQMSSIETEIRQVLVKLQQYNQNKSLLSKEQASLASLKEQAKNLKESLNGLSKESLITIHQHQYYEQEYLYISQIKESIEQLLKAEQILLQALDKLQVLTKLENEYPDKELVSTLNSHIYSGVLKYKDALIHGQEIFHESAFQVPAWKVIINQLEDRYNLHQREYEKAVQLNTTHQQQLNDIKNMEKEIATKEKYIENLRDEIELYGSPKVELRNKIKSLCRLYVKQRELMQEQCTKLTNLSGGLIQASLSKAGDDELLVKSIKETIQGAGIREDKIRDLVSKLSQNENPFETWYSIMDEILLLIEEFTEDNKAKGLPEVPLLRDIFTDNELNKLVGKLDMDKYTTLLLYKFKEKPIFQYRISDDLIDFDQASAGQQASALLRVLLSLEGPPLIIDQPEDDLDNEIIAQIAEEIWQAKQKRQIIFASHNANLVVNGDAELVVHFGYKTTVDQSSGEIKNEGSIDVPEIKEAIKSVMEGGETAFNLRREKYGF